MTKEQMKRVVEINEYLTILNDALRHIDIPSFNLRGVYEGGFDGNRISLSTNDAFNDKMKKAIINVIKEEINDLEKCEQKCRQADLYFCKRLISNRI